MKITSPSHSKKLPSIRAFLLKNVFLTIGLLTIVLVLAGEFLNYYVAQETKKRNLSASLAAIAAASKPDLEMGDMISVRRLLSSSIDSGALLAIKITDRKSNSIVFSYPYYPEGWKPELDMMWDTFDVNAENGIDNWTFSGAVEAASKNFFFTTQRAFLYGSLLLTLAVFTLLIYKFTAKLRRDIETIDHAIFELQNVNSSTFLLSSPKVFTAETERTLLHASVVLEKLRQLLEVEKKAAVSIGIARTTQSLAHDVRKPLTMVEMILNLAANMPSGNEAKEFIQNAIPEIRQAKASVEGMLQDVMQIGSDSKPTLEETAVESLVASCVNEVFRVYPEALVKLEYALQHTGNLRIDTNRLSRVCSNIAGNAVQAMKPNGTLSFASRNLPQNEWSEAERASGHGAFIELRIRNTGSCIPKEHLEKLFDAFYTFNKKGGTGLGLAIAKKNVGEHGGSIRCESETNSQFPAGFVEFIFTLPSTHFKVSESSKDSENSKVSENSESVKSDSFLPAHSSEIQSNLSAFKQLQPNYVETTEAQIEHELAEKLKERQSKNLSTPRILIVDDEAVYRNAFEELLRRGNELVASIPFATAHNSASAYEQISKFKPTILIQDIDLGATSHNGIQIIKHVRLQKFEGKICVHSNRFFMGDRNEAVLAGADLVLPKPMSRSHLLKFILASLQNDSLKPTDAKIEPRIENIEKMEKIERVHTSPVPTPAHSEKLKFAYIDDSRTMLVGMRMRVGDSATLHEFQSTQAFFETCKSDDSFLTSLNFIVTDYHFAPSDPHNGLSFCKELRTLGFAKPILVASDAELSAEELTTAGASKMIPKTLENWDELNREYESVSSQF
jgi:signal transduction histidine kinase/DNA-binding NarL/FixJ family response regulator